MELQQIPIPHSLDEPVQPGQELVDFKGVFVGFDLVFLPIKSMFVFQTLKHSIHAWPRIRVSERSSKGGNEEHLREGLGTSRKQKGSMHPPSKANVSQQRVFEHFVYFWLKSANSYLHILFFGGSLTCGWQAHAGSLVGSLPFICF